MAYTVQTSLDTCQAAYDLLAYYALRPQLYYDACADIEPSNQSMPGSTITWTQLNDLSAATTTLTETSDVTPVAPSASQVTLTLAEQGNALIVSALARGTSFLDIDKLVTNLIGYNAGLSLDTLVQAILQAGTNVRYAAGGAGRTSLISPTNNLGAVDIRYARAFLRRNNVPDFGGHYLCFVHPDQTYDLMGQTGTNTWTDPHAYSSPEQIWQGELGEFQNFRFIETPRAPEFAAGGSSSSNVYAALCLGRQALAKGYSYVDGNGAYPTIVAGPITDSLRRLSPWGWYWLGIYGIFRQSSLLRIESTSTIG